jgi:Zn-dependent protease
MDLFVFNLFHDDTRFYFLAASLVIVISIVLHELAHGWTAIRLGDDTPIHQGRMTGNPLVHMGPFSIVALLIAGIAWGQMPINPTRLRGRYAEAKVAAAGPAMNLGLAVVCLVGLGLFYRFGPPITRDTWQANLAFFLQIAGTLNLLLMMFNLIPIPPLDGSHILANLHRPYALALGEERHQGLFFVAFIFAFAMSSAVLVPWAARLAQLIVRWVETVGL